MKGRFFMKSRTAMRIMAIAVIGTWTPVGAWGADPPPLNQIRIPEPPNLFTFVKDKPAAIRLGKALFWDMQVGSDGVTACASCHYKAGADPIDVRSRNQLHPGPDTVFGNSGVNGVPGALQFAPDFILTVADFPFHQVSPVDIKLGEGQIDRDVNDVVGSQGVLLSQFLGVNPGTAVDITTPEPDPVFQVNGINVRRVTGINTPPTVNAVFNYNNFFNGRAHNTFNGSSPLGPLDQSAGIWLDSGSEAALVKEPVAIINASLASQATGPPRDDTEMSAGGRTWPDIGRKMLSLAPLAKQLVHPADSVLGSLSKAVIQPDGSTSGAKGISATYAQMIRDAFVDRYWNSNKLNPDGFTQMEANFSLYWGLAIQLYEATLVSDQTPFDRFLGGDGNAISEAAQRGWGTFQARCASCHSGSELSNATFSTVAFVSNADHNLIERGAIDADSTALSDVGFSNIGVRPTADNIGRGAGAAQGFPFPLSFSALAVLQATTGLPFATPELMGFDPADPVVTQGAFKTPQLRNIELTAPYMHNGSMFTLDEVVEFYTRGGNFLNAEKDTEMTDMGELRDAPDKRAEIVEFLKALTDERVRVESAPFDRPELLIVHGNGPMIRLDAKGAAGQAAVGLPTVTLDPFLDLVGSRSGLSVSGSKESGAQITAGVSGGQAFPAGTAEDTVWTTTITGFTPGNNTITVTALDLSGGITTISAAINVIFPDGRLSGGTEVSVADALKALRIAVSLDVPMMEDLLRGDVAPLGSGDGEITVADAMQILRAAVGLVTL